MGRMREIKFRIWDKLVKKMWQPENIVAIDFQSKCALINEKYKGSHWIYFRNAEMLQYTGLKDAQGNEIFEGDIVHIREKGSHVPNRDSSGGIIDYDWREGISQLGTVSFQGAWYTYETKQHIDGREEYIYAPLDFTNSLCVVGNIYENTELLKGGKGE